MKKVLAIVGPTAVGKSDLAIQIAQKYHVDIISGDSIQVYQGLDIGSGKVSKQQQAMVKHHLLDIQSAKQPFDVLQFQTLVRPLIEQSSPFALIAGGTGLYLKACLYDYAFQQEVPYQLTIPQEQWYTTLQEIDPLQACKIHPNNLRRIERSLIKYYTSGISQSEQEAKQTHQPLYDVLWVGLTRPREHLYQAINQRVEQMFQQGLPQEVDDLLRSGITFEDPGMKGIGYKEFAGYYRQEMTLQQVRELIQKNSRHFAKRQYTWFTHQVPVEWFNVEREEEMKLLWEKIEHWSK